MKLTRKINVLVLGCALTIGLVGCGGEAAVDGAAVAQEICDCYSAANGLPADDPNRSAAQDKCGELQKTNWDKVAGNSEQEKAFNDAFPCGM